MFDIYQGKKIGIFGLGKAGKAALIELAKSGAEIYAWDDNSDSANCDFCDDGNVKICPIKDWPWGELDTLVLSPGIALTHPKPHPVVELARENNCPIICDIELLYCANPDAKFIGVTGTNGKSTTTALIGHIIKQLGGDIAVGGNIGTPASQLPKSNIYLLETSSYQLDLIEKTKFNISILLNITPDHLDRHGDMQNYIKAKKHIFDNQGKGDVAIIATDDDYCREIYEELKQTEISLIPISGYSNIANGICVRDGIIYDNINEKKINLGQLPHLAGKHNGQNIAASYAAVSTIMQQDMTSAIKSFAGLEHRLQLVAEINGIKFVNDSKATNDVASRQALLAYDNIYWILGGVAKEGGIDSLKSLFKKIKHAFLIGQAEDEFAATLAGEVSYSKCGTMQNAVAEAKKMAKENSGNNPVVLLSPACASFDQYANFEQRGQDFIKIIQEDV